MGLPLLSDDNLLRQYLGPLKVLEVNTLIAEFKDEFVGVYHDGTTYLGERIESIESILVEYWRNFEWFVRGLNRLFGRFLQ